MRNIISDVIFEGHSCKTTLYGNYIFLKSEITQLSGQSSTPLDSGEAVFSSAARWMGTIHSSRLTGSNGKGKGDNEEEEEQVEEKEDEEPKEQEK